MNADAIAAALTTAMPALAGTVFPALICIGADRRPNGDKP